jgi:chemotaxis protein MotB
MAKWMATFSDMNQLLMCFFVLLVSMANFDPVKMREVFGILQGNKSILSNPAMEDSNPINIVMPKGTNVEETKKEKAVESLQTYIETQNLQQMVSVIETEQGFNVSILDSVLFRVGSYEIQPAAYPILDQLSAMAAVSEFYLNVKGHADDQIAGQNRTANWNLAANRALSVLNYTEDHGVAGARLSATSFGQYHPLLPNISEQNRAANRRVEISFITPEWYEANKDIFGDSTTSPME